jgi:hypothetical protein
VGVGARPARVQVLLDGHERQSRILGVNLTPATLDLLEATIACARGYELFRAVKGGDRGLGDTSTADALADQVELGITRGKTVALGRIGSAITHKASNAKDILRHCLKRRGWTSAWKKQRLTGKEHLQLLSDVRLYCRAWFRHEAEGVFDDWANSADIDFGTPVGRSNSSRCDLGLGRQVDSDTRSDILRSVSGAISRFFGRAKVFVREMILAGVLALRGPGKLSAQEAGSIDSAVAVQVDYLENFQREVEASPPRPPGLETTTILVQPEPMTEGQFVARAEMYGNAVWQAAQGAYHDEIVAEAEQPPPARPPGTTTPPVGLRYERRILGHPKTHHCEDCPPLAALGWQPIGTLPRIGETECGGMCLCRFEYTDDPDSTKVKRGGPHRPTRPKGGGRPPKPPGQPRDFPGDPNGGWKTPQGTPVKFELGPDVMSEPTPSGYHYEEAE